MFKLQLLDGVAISDGEDPVYSIIRQAIRKRWEHLNRATRCIYGVNLQLTKESVNGLALTLNYGRRNTGWTKSV